MYRYGILVLCLCVLPAAVVCADAVYFTNGDKLSGEIVSLSQGKLVFKSEMAGEVTIDFSKVGTLESDKAVVTHLSDGTVVRQKLVKSAQGGVEIEAGKDIKTQRFKLSSIEFINPPPAKKPQWKGSISAGFTSTHGNTVTDSRNVSVNLQRKGEDDRVTIKGDYARSRQKDPDTGDKKVTENWWRTRAKYDYFFTKKNYLYINGRYEKDSIADLKRRVVAGGGGGYQWIEAEKMNFFTEAGLASVYEKFESESESNTEVSAELGYHFDRKLMKWITFLNDLTYYPSLEEFSDYYLTSTWELRASVTEKMFTNFKVIFDYDATPAVGAGNTDVKYILGVGWNF